MSYAGAVASSPVQAGLYALLAADSAFMALVGSRFYTDVPQGTAFPSAWLTFGDPMETEQATFGKFGAVVHCELHAYSAYEGDDECLDILSRGMTVLHQSTPTVSGYTVPFVTAHAIPHSIAIEDFNGKALRHGIARIDVHVFG